MIPQQYYIAMPHGHNPAVLRSLPLVYYGTQAAGSQPFHNNGQNFQATYQTGLMPPNQQGNEAGATWAGRSLSIVQHAHSAGTTYLFPQAVQGVIKNYMQSARMISMSETVSPLIQRGEVLHNYSSAVPLEYMLNSPPEQANLSWYSTSDYAVADGSGDILSHNEGIPDQPYCVPNFNQSLSETTNIGGTVYYPTASQYSTAVYNSSYVGGEAYVVNSSEPAFYYSGSGQSYQDSRVEYMTSASAVQQEEVVATWPGPLMSIQPYQSAVNANPYGGGHMREEPETAPLMQQESVYTDFAPVVPAQTADGQYPDTVPYAAEQQESVTSLISVNREALSSQPEPTAFTEQTVNQNAEAEVPEQQEVAGAECGEIICAPKTAEDRSDDTEEYGSKQVETTHSVKSEIVSTAEVVGDDTSREFIKTEIPLARGGAAQAEPDSADAIRIPEFRYDGSCRPKEKTVKNKVVRCSFSVQDVLDLELCKKEQMRHSEVLDLLYLKGFDFSKKIKFSNDVDVSGQKIKKSKNDKKKELKYYKEELHKHGIKMRMPTLSEMNKMYSEEALMAAPTDTVNIHIRHFQLCHVASMIDLPRYVKRTEIINSLSAGFAAECHNNRGYVREITRVTEKRGAEAREVAEVLLNDDKANFDLIVMSYFPYCKPRLIPLKAPFLKAVPTLFCNPDLSYKSLGNNMSGVISEEERSAFETLGYQLIKTGSSLQTLVRCLAVKMSKLAKDENQPNPPESFSKQCINMHVTFTCDIVHKMLLLVEGRRHSDIGCKSILITNSLLDMIQTMHRNLPIFNDEYIMAISSLCFLLQNKGTNEIFSAQKKCLLDLDKLSSTSGEIFRNIVPKMEDTLIQALESSLQNPGRLHIFMCLLHTIPANEMFLPAVTEAEKKRLIRLAICSTEIVEKLSFTLAEGDGKNSQEYPERILRTCIPVFQAFCQHISQGIPGNKSTVALEREILKLIKQCEERLDKIKRAQNLYYEEELASSKKYMQGLLKIIQERNKQTDQAHEIKIKKHQQMIQAHRKLPAENQNGLEKQNPVRQALEKRAALITTTENLLKQFKEKMDSEASYETVLADIDNVFVAIADDPILQVWVYGDIAYYLCKLRSDDFNRAALFVRTFHQITQFCSEMLEEVLKAEKQKYDHEWLYSKNTAQPISKRNIILLMKFSDPEKIQALVERAARSVSFYGHALDKAKIAFNNLLEQRENSQDPDHILLEKQHLYKRIGFVNEEIKSVRQYLTELRPIPVMSQLFDKKSYLFSMLKSSPDSRAERDSAGTAGNEINEAYARLVKDAETENNLDERVSESRDFATKELELIMREFKVLGDELIRPE